MWSTFLGGRYDEEGRTLALDAAGNVAVAGATFSPDFPATSGAFDASYNGSSDVFVAKLSGDGSQLLWATFLGGSERYPDYRGEDYAYALALDAAANFVVAGVTSSPDFPTTPGAYDTSHNGGEVDAFVAKLSEDGSQLLWATFLGGSVSVAPYPGKDFAYALALDVAGNIVVAGETSSSDFPTTPGAYDTSWNGSQWNRSPDGFVAKLSADGSQLLWATFLGGSGPEAILDLDGSGDIVAAGWTNSSDFPATQDAYDTSFNGGSDTFIAKLSGDGSQLLWSSFLGGSDGHSAWSLALDAEGSILLAGYTQSTDFPITVGAYDTSPDWPEGDVFLARLALSTVLPPEPPGPTAGLVLAGGADHSLVRLGQGATWAWGNNLVGQLGDGTTSDRSTPIRVSGLSQIVAVAAGAYHSLALKNDGTVWAWGYNLYGQLGDGTTTNRLTPVQVSGLTDVVAIAAGYGHSLALKGDGTVWAWGNNERGRLGDGTNTDRWTPVQVSGLIDVLSVAAGSSHSLAVKLDGTVWAWGNNDNGQLGDGGRAHERWTPVMVSGLTGVVAVAAGTAHSLALREDGTVWAWGSNFYGQVGNGTVTTEFPTPSRVSGLSEIVAVGAGGFHSLALKSDGTVWAWGWNGSGQLGDGTTIDRRTAVQVSFPKNSVPVAEAGPNQQVRPGVMVQLDGTASYDPDGDPLSYRWSFNLRPPGSAAVLSDPADPRPKFVADRVGRYEVQLVVNDGLDDSAPDSVSGGLPLSPPRQGPRGSSHPASHPTGLTPTN